MFKNKRVVVTGGNGMIGRKLVDILCERGAKVTVLSLDSKKIREDVEYINCDLAADFECCQLYTENTDYVFHLAGLKGSPKATSEKPASYFVPLLQMNTNMLEACRVNEVKRVLFTSSIGAYSYAEKLCEANTGGEPMDTYPGWAKRMGELQVRAYKIENENNRDFPVPSFSVVRPSNVYGEGDMPSEQSMFITALMGKVARGDNPVEVWGDGSEVRDFVYSSDVAMGMVQALELATGGEFINLGGREGVSVRDVVETLQTITPFEAKYLTDKATGFPVRVMDITKAREMIGYNPATTLEEGLSKTWKWFKLHYRMSG